MTHEEAIQAIVSNWPDERYTMLREALTLAITELRAYQKPTDDAVKRAIDAVSGILNDNGTFSLTGHYRTILTALKQYQKPTDDDVQRAIEWHARKTTKPSNPYWFLYRGDRLVCHALKEDVEEILTALRQMRTEPTDEELQRAIKYLMANKRDIRDAYGEGYTQGYFDCQANMDYPQDEAVQRAIVELSTVAYQYLNAESDEAVVEIVIEQPLANAIDLAITALRQMRTEPCEFCKNGISSSSVMDWKGMMRFVMGAVHYCPNCGRKLEG